MPNRIRLPQPRQTPASSRGGKSTQQPQTKRSAAPTWDPQAVSNLISQARRQGKKPAVLCVGRNEAAALTAYLTRHFGDGGEVTLKNQVYAGLKIVELREDSLLEVETLESIFEGSRHAQILQIKEEMERSPRGRRKLDRSD